MYTSCCMVGDAPGKMVAHTTCNQFEKTARAIRLSLPFRHAASHPKQQRVELQGHVLAAKHTNVRAAIGILKVHPLHAARGSVHGRPVQMPSRQVCRLSTTTISTTAAVNVDLV